ncbi:MAG: ATP-binding protein [Acidimicrobiia bacterium]|nr:ATP-binding protein [Acidimicrobiia bacterium]
MRFVLREGTGPHARADVAMLTALGLPGGGIVSVGETHVRVVPGSVRTPNVLELPPSAFGNGAGRPGQAVDVVRTVLPVATTVTIEIDGAEATAVPAQLIGVPVSSGDAFPLTDGTARIANVHPSPDVVLSPSTVVSARARAAVDERVEGPGTASTLVAGLENERDLLVGWLRLITGPHGTESNGAVAGVIITGPTGSGRAELLEAAAADADLEVRHIDLRTVTTPERLLSKFERAAGSLRPGVVLSIDRLDPLMDRESGTRHQAAAVTRWLLDTVADTPGVAVVISSTRPSIGDELDAKELLRRTLTLSPPDHRRRKALLEAAIGPAAVEEGEIDLDTLANATPGFSALDISTAILEARATSATLTTESILEAIRSTPASLGTMQLGDVPSYGFERVANLNDVKRSLTENVIWQLTDPGRFERMGIEPAKGLLLHGPPGTGKTFVVRALAHESGAAFFAVKGAELLDKWVGESERGVREVFTRARAVAPAIIFFDEIDALAPVRGSSTNNVTDSVVAALLTEMDGVSERGDVFVIGATNRRDLIDPALLRPGRLEVHLLLDLPAPEAREAFFSMTSVPLADDVELAALVEATEGRSFAELDGLLRQAAISAMRSDPHASDVSWDHLEAALTPSEPS